jgi:hypothetical protein
VALGHLSFIPSSSVLFHPIITQSPFTIHRISTSSLPEPPTPHHYPINRCGETRMETLLELATYQDIIAYALLVVMVMAD